MTSPIILACIDSRIGWNIPLRVIRAKYEGILFSEEQFRQFLLFFFRSQIDRIAEIQLSARNELVYLKNERGLQIDSFIREFISVPHDTENLTFNEFLNNQEILYSLEMKDGIRLLSSTHFNRFDGRSYISTVDTKLERPNENETSSSLQLIEFIERSSPESFFFGSEIFDPHSKLAALFPVIKERIVLSVSRINSEKFRCRLFHERQRNQKHSAYEIILSGLLDQDSSMNDL